MRKSVAVSSKQFTAIDLFSGAGGISLGFTHADFKVLGASDSIATFGRTYEHNFPEHRFVQGDIRDLVGGDFLRATDIAAGELDVLVGGPPCQGFSILGSRLVFDPRNDLFRHFLRVAKELRPRCLVMENVPGLATLAGGRVLQHILDEFREAGYQVNFAELLAAQYGVPQMRWRMVFVAWRADQKVSFRMGFPKPTHGRTRIGELVPNCAISPEDMRGFVTTRDAIGDLPPTAAGEERQTYDSAPKLKYQKLMRQGATNQLFNHYAPKLSPQNVARIEALEPGQDWRDLPLELLPEGMRRAKRKDHTRRYSRMTWEGVPRSIITRFRDPKSGEYMHPEQTRTISIREAARIQSFPDRFEFCGGYSEQYDQVGNAVPPLLAAAIAQEVRACLQGSATYQMENQFSRRPSLLQASLSLDAS